MKSLYSLLGITPDASTAQIETAYAELLSELGKNPAEDSNVRLIAAKEAYAVLSDPVKRQQYNQKLFAPEAAVRSTTTFEATPISEPATSGFTKILVISAIVAGGIGYYTHQVKETERLRIEHEHRVKMKAVQVLEQSSQRADSEQNARLERLQKLDEAATARREESEHERFLRESEQQRRENERAERQARQQELAEQRAAEMQKRAEMAEARQRAAKDKDYLQRLERERYGRTLSY